MTKQKWTKQKIRANMEDTSVSARGVVLGDVWVIRGMLALLEKQTPEEQQAGIAVEDNGMGFNGVDAEILTSFCEQVKRHLSKAPKADQFRYSRALSPKQMEIARKKMLKYSGQLAGIANSQQDKS